MDQSPLDKQDADDNDGHEVRIVRLEVKMDQTAIALASMQRSIEVGFAEQRRTNDTLRAEQQTLRAEMQRLFEKLSDRIDEQAKEHRRDIRWVTGLILTTTIATLGVAVRLLYLM